ncbi:hypothetical protein RFI_28984 [Reticulomyxa filosa]|uniref:V-SNARE coiled-coil homology domain-containing protein n=1 Tax=Reticulomyxa filosa TaxID=46433 RepID=X6M3A6_RETFI|nr:hypothetical protein RFI_28984 [Reticulomyxa filosa]|eukprot:ETO08404.1 hypothetical protein RFI_28984 [Reticulomyxa filosa]
MIDLGCSPFRRLLKAREWGVHCSTHCSTQLFRFFCPIKKKTHFFVLEFCFNATELQRFFFEQKKGEKSIQIKVTSMAGNPRIQYSLVATLDTLLIEANVGSSSAKYVRCCRKILKKISSGELRRPDEKKEKTFQMDKKQVLFVFYAYNYVHGCEPDDQQPNKENLIFLCVTEALPYAATPTETREAAHFFLTKIRKSFLETFRASLDLFCNTSAATASSETQSADSSSLINIDQSLKNQLRMFSSFMKTANKVQHKLQKKKKKDAMATLADDPSSFQEEALLDSDSGAMDYKDIENKDRDESGKHRNNSNFGGGSNNELYDLRTKPPPPGHRMYQSSSGSKISQIINQIDHIKDTVRQNIGMFHAMTCTNQNYTAIDRHETIVLLQQKADDVQESSGLFRRRSRQVQYQYCRDLYQQRCVLISIVVVRNFFLIKRNRKEDKTLVLCVL